MATDDITLIGLGIAAIVVLWLVFSLVRKVFGLALIAALALGAWMLWTNPGLRGAVLSWMGMA